jgi:hypothetical protein
MDTVQTWVQKQSWTWTVKTHISNINKKFNPVTDTMSDSALFRGSCSRHNRVVNA